MFSIYLYANSEEGLKNILDSIGRDVIDRAVVPGQGGVVVASDAGRGEFIQDVLGLMEGHQTHAEQGEAETQTNTTDIVTAPDCVTTKQRLTCVIHSTNARIIHLE